MKKSISEKRGFVAGLLAVLFTWGAYFVYIFPRIFFWQNNNLFAFSNGVWGDWGAHLTYASVFAYKPFSLWLMHPAYLGHKFNYPFGADFISGLLMRINIDYVSAFIIPSILTSIFLLIMLYLFYFHFLKNPKYVFIAITIFLTSGGLGFIWFAQDFIQKPELNTLLFPPREYTVLENENIKWFNIVVHEFLPQRGILLGIPLMLVFIMLLLHWQNNKFKVSNTKIALAGFFSSAMLFFHVHSYIAFAFFCILLLIKERNYWRKIFVFGISASIPSLIIFYIFHSGNVSGFLQFYPGWLSNAKALNTNFFYFWMLNWGFFLPIAVFSIWKKKLYKHFLILGAIIIFIICNLFILQPYDWDNSKLFTWVYLLFSIPVTLFLVDLWSKKIQWKIISIVLFIIIIASGALDLIRLTHAEELSAQFLSADEIYLAESFRKISNPADIVLTSDKHNHWVSTLTGRQILMGYNGWLWSYGINYEKRREEILKMFSGSSEAGDLLKHYNIRYVVIGPSERTDFNANEVFFKEKYELVLEKNDYAVYRFNTSYT